MAAKLTGINWLRWADEMGYFPSSPSVGNFSEFNGLAFGTYKVLCVTPGRSLTVNIPPKRNEDPEMVFQFAYYQKLLKEARLEDDVTGMWSTSRSSASRVEFEIKQWAETWYDKLHPPQPPEDPLPDAYVECPDELPEEFRCQEYHKSWHPAPKDYWQCLVCLQNLTGDRLCSTSTPPTPPSETSSPTPSCTVTGSNTGTATGSG